MAPRAQAELGDAAVKEQAAYRNYLLQRLLPAMAAFYNRGNADFDAASITMGNVLELHRFLPIVVQATTSDLEKWLTRFRDRLLMVRKQQAQGIVQS